MGIGWLKRLIMDEFQKAVLRRLTEIEDNQSTHERDIGHFKKLLEDVQINFSKVHGEMQALKEEMGIIRDNINKNTKTTLESAEKVIDKIEESNE